MRNPNPEEMEGLNDSLHDQELAQAEFDLHFRKLRRKYNVPEEASIDLITHRFVLKDKAGNDMPLEAPTITDKEIKKSVELDENMKIIMAEARFMMAKLRQRCSVPVWTKVNEAFAWVDMSGKPMVSDGEIVDQIRGYQEDGTPGPTGQAD